ncbi:MAG: sulfatase [Planctomycetota bacterium]|nr:sulfatase [Planctomycetota bacterium]
MGSPLQRLSRLIGLFLLPLTLVNAADNNKPNIVFMIADDCTFRDVGCYGGQAHTPNIDKLASEGMRFTRCFQSTPMCSPTRHNIYTGLYPVTSGAYPNHTHVESGTRSVVQYLKELGYRVAQSGKTHVAPASVFRWEKIPGASNPEFGKVDAFMGDCAKSNAPFCLLLCSNEPHSPWNKGDPSRYPPEKIQLPAYFVDTPQTRSSMSRYLAEITYYDGQAGEAMALLDKHGMTENTLVVVVSEQGSSFPFAKWTCYDNGLQSALIARWPGRIQPASVNPAMIEYIDLLPTFVEAAGGKPDPSLQGNSLLPVFAGGQHHKQHVFGIMTTRGINAGSDHFGIRSVRSEKYKYIWNLTPDAEFKNACTNSPEFKSWQELAATGNADAIAKVKRYQFRPEIELYDVEADPLEMKNLASDIRLTDTMTQLRAELDRWMFRCGDKGQETEMKALEHMARGRKETK